MDEVIVQAKAREFLKQHRVESYPVDAKALAETIGFKVVFDDDLSSLESGYSLKRRNKKGLVINANDSPERQRFTILHEVAHDVLNLPSNHGYGLETSELESYQRRPQEEIACDIFAAECLVPWYLLKPLTDSYSFDKDSIDELAGDFQASRSCMASRFAQESSEKHIYILSESGVIKNVVSSKDVTDMKYWVEIGISLPKESVAFKALKSEDDTLTDEYGANIWSGSPIANQYFCYEEVITLPNWNQTLSLITLEEREIEDQQRHQNTDDDILLDELSGVLPWR